MKTPDTRTSLQRRVVDDYFRTTSASGSAHSPATFDASMVQLRRRLGPWLDVRGKDVLDLGSGTGELCSLAQREAAASVVGVNLSSEEIEFARSRTSATFVQCEIASYLEQCPPASADCVYALNILEHLDKDSLLRTMEGIYRVLRDGGQLVAMVPNAISPFGTMTRYWDITHQIAFTPSSVRQVARLVGFDDAEFRECGPVAARRNQRHPLSDCGRRSGLRFAPG